MSQSFAPPPKLSPELFVAVIHSDSDLQVLFRWPDMPLRGQKCDKVPNSVVEPIARTTPSVWHVSKMTRTIGVPAARHSLSQSQPPAWKNMKALAWALLKQTVNIINTEISVQSADCAEGPVKHHLTFCHSKNTEFVYMHNDMQEN